MRERLCRSTRDRVLFGVCGGLGEYLDIDSAIIRTGFVLLALASGAGLVAYVALLLLMPSAVPAGEGSAVHRAEETPGPLGQPASPSPGPTEDVQWKRRRNAAGAILVVIGLLLLAVKLDLFWWFRWSRWWPLLLVLAGLVLLMDRLRRRA